MAESDKINQAPAGGTQSTAVHPNTPVQPPRKEESQTPIIDQAKLMELLHTVEQLRKSDEEKTKEIERLRYAADKNRLVQFDSKEAQRKSLIPKCKVSYWNGSLILAHKMLPQEVYFLNGVYHEKQDVEMRLKGSNDPVVVTYKDWFQKVEKRDADIIKRSTDIDGNNVLTVELDNGEQIELNVLFVN